MIKADVIEALGEAALARPAQLNAALCANDRLKYYFSLLQMARSRADRPDQPAASLKRERLTSGVADETLDQCVGGARRAEKAYRIPGCQQILRHIADDLKIMAAPADPSFAQRMEALLATLPAAPDDMISGASIDAITRAGKGEDDSLHRLVMELHKALNALQAELAQETIDGAAVYEVTEPDRALIRAFMAGLNRTAPLKFDHPGLGATATRIGSRLVIQNDLGTTDAHVLVIHVEDLKDIGMRVSLTYSDVHLERLAFFRSLFEQQPMSWSDPETRSVRGLAEGQPFFITTGSFTGADAAAMAPFLTFLGSRLVFVIDWNRARKQLRAFLKKSQRTTLLRWAADNDIGHRGFLEIGGDQMVYDAIEASASGLFHIGDRLCSVLGDEVAYAYLQFCFRAATEGLLANQSPALIRDRVRAELLVHMASGERRLLAIAADHAALIFEIATGVRDGLLAARAGEGGLQRLTHRASHWEHQADLCVIEARQIVQHRPDFAPYSAIMQVADDAADHLEESAFLLGLFPAAKGARAELDPLRKLADILVAAAQEWIKALTHAVHVEPHGAREDADDFLIAIDRIASLEHDADEAQRQVTIAALREAADFRQLHLITAIGDALERSSDALKHGSLLLRDHVLADVLTP